MKYRTGAATGKSRRINARLRSPKGFGEAVRCAVEQLEGRLLFAAVAQPGAPGSANASALTDGPQAAPLSDTLPPPTNFRVIGQSPTGIGLAWSTIAGAAGYTVYRAPMNPDGTPGAFTAIATGVAPSGAGTESFADASADDNGATSYVYRVATQNASGTGPQSGDLIASSTFVATGGQGWTARFQDGNTVTDRDGQAEYIALYNLPLNIVGLGEQNRFPITPPAFNTNGSPGASFAVTLEGKVTVPWTAVWHLYPATGDGARVTVDGVVLWDNFTAVQNVTERDLTVKDAPSPTNAGGNAVVWKAGSVHTIKLDFQQGTGEWSDRLMWAPNGDARRKAVIPTGLVNPLIPTPPVLSGSVDGQTVQLNWAQVDAASYRIQQSDNSGTTWNDVPNMTVLATPATALYSRKITGVSNQQQHSWQVIATNALGSATSNVLAPVVGPTVPPQPTGVTATAAPFSAGDTTMNVTVSWNAVAFAKTYRVERATVDAAGTPGVFANVATGLTATSYVDVVPVGARYVYRVTAIGTNGESPASANTPVVNLADPVHEYRYLGSDVWKSGASASEGWRNVGDDFDSEQRQPNVQSAQSVGDNFSRLYTGKVHISETGDYTFATNSDEDSYLTVDGKLVASLVGSGVDAYLGGTRTDSTTSNAGTPVPLHLLAGHDYDFQYWHRDAGGADFAFMKWQATNLDASTLEAGATAPPTALAVVPPSQFRVPTGAPTAPTGLTVTGFGAKTLSMTFNDTATNELHFRVERASVTNNTPGPFQTVRLVLLQENAGGTLVSFSDVGLLPNSTYVYRVRAENFEGVSAPSNLIQMTTAVPAAVPGGTLTYYDNQWWGSPNQSTSGLRSPGSGNYENQINITDRTTATAKLIDFHSYDPNAQLPFGPAGDDGFNYSVVISGQLRAPETGTYKFITQSDDDSYFVVNGKLVSQWAGAHGDADTSGMTLVPITLTAGQEYNYQYYMSEGGGDHGFHARWVIPSDTTAYDAVNGGAGYEKAPLIPMFDAAANPSTVASKGGFTIATEDVPPAPTVPPGGAAAVYTSVANDSVKINFTDNAVSELRYVLERSSSPTFATIDAATDMPMVLSTAAAGGAGGVASFTVIGLTAVTEYYFRLRASNYDGQSANLDLGKVTTLGLATPSQPLARVLSNGDVKLTWNDVLPLGTKVSISRSSDGVTYTELAQVNQIAGGGANTYTDATAKAAGTPYKYRLQTIGGAGGTISPAVDVPYTVLPQGPPQWIDYRQGFAAPLTGTPNGYYDGSSMNLRLVGNANSVAAGLPAVVDDDGDGIAVLRLTNTNLAGGQASAIWSVDKVPVAGRWMTQFDFQLNPGAIADGFTFALQNNSNTFVGGGGGGGGYDGIGANALGIGFDTYNGISKTGAFIGNSGPTTSDAAGSDPYVAGQGFNTGLNLNPGGTGVDLKSGHNLRAVLSYDGTNLSEMVIDLDDASRVVFNYDYGRVNLSQVLGGDTAWVGFTAATGRAFEQVDVKNWVFSKPEPPDPPAVWSFTVDDGTSQRSQVKSLSISFDTRATLAPGALKLIQYGTDATGVVTNATTDISSVLSAPTSSDGGITWKWTFTPNASSTTEANGSLADGIYQVFVDHTKVSLGGTTMANDFTSQRFHRLFGDINNSKSVNNADFAVFRNSFLKPASDPSFQSGFDFDGNGVVNNADFGQFRRRFLKTFTYT